METKIHLNKTSNKQIIKAYSSFDSPTNEETLNDDENSLQKANENVFDADMDDFANLIRRLRQANMPENVRIVVTKDLLRLRRMPSHMPEYAIIRGYLELLADLPWTISTVERIDLKQSRIDLDAEHYGLNKLKERVLQYLAVRKLQLENCKGQTPSSQPILLFVGPPGTGKTSIARSIANSLKRKFQRISLGGVADQSDIRGHRRTYIGSMPGRIIQGIKSAGVNNPVFLLDELDKLSPLGLHGDPSAALLEVLDLEQNHSFIDHYLNVPFDLSRVLFIATANSVREVPPVLLDRMEVITVAGYTHEEKFDIAKTHLIPRQILEHGLSENLIKFNDDAIQKLTTQYAIEPGVRNLERKIAAVCRVVAMKILEQESHPSIASTSLPVKIKSPFIVTADNLEHLLGPARFGNVSVAQTVASPGVAVGLAWSPFGGEILFVEAEVIVGTTSARNNLVLTGQLGSVMRESARLAVNWLRANCHLYSSALSSSTSRDLALNTVHIHFPEGAVSKDGPSAGVAIVCALFSHCSKLPIIASLAMTGEITLRGHVLRVGGIKDKVLAAQRAGITQIILPSKNESDLVDLPRLVREKLTFHLVDNLTQVIQVAFNVQVAQIENLETANEISQTLTSKL